MGVSEDWTLYYHPDVTKWPLDTLETVWLHEIWHLLRSHIGRSKSLGVGPQQQLAWNVAADCEINDGLVDAKRPFPPGLTPCLPAMLQKPNDLTAEEYYQAIKQQGKGQSGQGQGKGKASIGGSCADGIARPWEKPGQGQGQGQGKDKDGQGQAAARVVPTELIKKQVAEEIASFKPGPGQGSVPSAWKRWAGDSLTVRALPWEVVFRSVVGRVVAAGRREEYTYASLPRRQMLGDFILPGQVGTVPDVCVGVDTSGSMSDKQLAMALDILENVLEHLGRTYALTVVTCDAAVQATKRVMSGRSLPLTGGGGTDMGTLIAHVQTLKPMPQVLVVITDCYTPWPERAPAGLSMVVVRVGDGEAPSWATVVDARDGKAD
jgi:predicted metal-dependent peptidase